MVDKDKKHYYLSQPSWAMDLQNTIVAKQDYGGKTMVVFIVGIESRKSLECFVMKKESSIGLGGCHSCLFLCDC